MVELVFVNEMSDEEYESDFPNETSNQSDTSEEGLSLSCQKSKLFKKKLLSQNVCTTAN